MNDPTARQPSDYRLEEQVGFLLRRATQRHLAIFARHLPDLTPRQFAALARLCELGEASQNALGRAVAMDAATIKGVVDRLRRRGLIAARPDSTDARRLLLCPSALGRETHAGHVAAAFAISEETLAPLEPAERRQLLALLNRLA